MSIKRGIIQTFLTQVPVLALYFIVSMVMTRVLGEEGRGEFALLQNVIVLAGLALGLNFPLGIMFHMARDKSGHRVPVGMAVSGLLLNVLVMPAIVLVIAGNDRLREVFFPGRLAHWGYYAYVIVSVWLNLLNSFIGAMFLGLKRFRIVNRITLTGALLNAIGIGLVRWSQDPSSPTDDLPAALTVMLVGSVVQAVAWCIVYARHIGLRPTPMMDRQVIKAFLVFSMTGYLVNLINLISYRFDTWVVNGYAGTANLGLYAVAVGVGQMFFNIPEPLSRVTQPFLYENGTDAMLERFKAIARLNFTAVAVLCAIAGATAQWVVPLLFGPDFSGSVEALRWLLPGIAMACAYKLINVLLVQRGSQRFNLLGAVLGAIVTVVLDLLLIPRMGIIGAGLASTIAYATILLVTCLVLQTRLGIRASELFIARPGDIRLLRSTPAVRPPAQ